MPKYRSREVIEAIQWKPPMALPKWLHDAGFKQRRGKTSWQGFVAQAMARPGDFIVRFPLAVYRQDEFNKLYERIEP